MEIKFFTATNIDQKLDDLCQLLIESVQMGGAVGFLAPLSKRDAIDFWKNSVRPEVLNKKRILLVAVIDERVIGTVQLLHRLQPNQPHRCEIAKMMVHPQVRRQGIGRALMKKAVSTAEELNKNLVTLDTKVGDVAESMYRSLGFADVGIVPDFALNPDGQDFHSTIYMYRRI